MKAIKGRLSVMIFLEFAVWGAYLTSMGAFLYKIGLQDYIGWFYAVQGIVSIFMPALIGILADRWIPAQKMLSLCHIIAGAFMIGAGWYAMDNIDAGVSFAPLFTLYSISVAFFMPTIGLSNSVSYTILGKAGLDTVKHFPPIRTLGTVGFIVSMLITNFAGFQNSYLQFFSSGLISFVLALYSLTLPACPVAKKRKNQGGGIVEVLGLKAFALFKNKQMAIFFIFSMLLGVSLQITNGFANPYIQSFGEVEPYKSMHLWAVDNANALISISQMSEALCILLIPFFLKRYGIKVVMLMSMIAWVLRFGFFGLGNPAFPGVILFILSMIVYGVAFDFFNVSGSLYVDQKTEPSIRSSAQGLFMLMTNGLGATFGVLGAQVVIDKLVNVHTAVVNNTPVITDPAAYTQGWHTSWYIFAAFALVVAVAFFFCFKEPHKRESGNKKTTEITDEML